MKRFLAPLLLLAVLALAALAAGCGGGGGSDSNKVAIVAYSTPKEAYESIIPQFQKTPEGKGVEFTGSYGPSGDQSRAVVSGQRADIVAFSLEPDITRLVDEGLVADDWNANPEKGMVTDSVVVLVTRKGNPKNIKGWNDLTKPGTEVITPNPFTSGGARWNVMAAYGSQIKQGKSEEEATQFLSDLFKNVSVQDASARDSLSTFTGGKGDVLLAYENEAIAAQQAGEDIDYVIPDQTILIENPIAVTEDSENKKESEAFVKYLLSDAGQKGFAAKGYRPVHENLVDKKQFPTPKQLFTIQEFGGWDEVTDKFFDPENGVMAGIEKELGVPTDG
jgi:sulfate transport system substrate-binding protein